MDWASIETLRNVINKHLEDVRTGRHLRPKKEVGDFEPDVYPEWVATMEAAVLTLAHELHLGAVQTRHYHGDRALADRDEPAAREKSILVAAARELAAAATTLLEEHKRR